MASFIASISMAGILYFSYRQVSRAMFLLFVLIVYSSFLGWRVDCQNRFQVAQGMVGHYPAGIDRGFWPARGAGPQADRDSECRQHDLCGYVDDAQVLPPKTRPLLQGGIKDIRAVIEKSGATDVVIALPYSVYQRMGEVVDMTKDMPVKVWVALGFFDLALYRTDIEDFAGIPMLDLRAGALSDYQLLVKRGFDLFFGVFALSPDAAGHGVYCSCYLDRRRATDHLSPGTCRGERPYLRDVQIQDDGQGCG